MARRRFEKVPASYEEAGAKPSIESVLDLWGCEYTHRTSQMIRCPLHEDATPSCSINTDKGLWNCHSCGSGGDVWTLIELREEVDFAGARAFAAAQSLTTGDAGGSGLDVRAGRFGGRGSLPAGSRDRGADSPYVPSWRRRGSSSGP